MERKHSITEEELVSAHINTIANLLRSLMAESDQLPEKDLKYVTYVKSLSDQGEIQKQISEEFEQSNS